MMGFLCSVHEKLNILIRWFCPTLFLYPKAQHFRMVSKNSLFDIFVALNSAWFCRGDEDRRKLWLGKPLLEKMAANRQLIHPDNYDEDESPITLALFHHPHEWLNETEYNTYGNRQNSLEYLAERSHVILNGHVHSRPAKPGRWINRAWTVKGGASYAEHSYQNHFSILRIDAATRTFERLTYEFDPGKNRWRKDGDEYNPPAYELKQPTAPPAAPHLIIPGKYKEWVSAQCEDMDIAKLAGRSTVIRVRLPEIYIPLFVNFRDRMDIEDLIPQEQTLVIEGRAGSGKTTLAKHFTHMMIQPEGWKGLEGYIPVLVFLKDLKGFDTTGLPGNSDTGEKILEHWSKATDSFLDVETIRGFCEAGKAVFFLDGLDEIDESLRELVVRSFTSIRIKYSKCKIILSGRPHGVDDAVKKWFGDRHVEILPLLMAQVEDFIRRWFEFVYEGERTGAKKMAPDMIGEIKIIQKILEEDEGKPFPRRRLAARSFIDIHRDNRDHAVIETVVNRLWRSIDSRAEQPVRAEAGDLLGGLGDERDLEVFVQAPDGTYKTSIGKVNIKSFEMAKYPVTNRWFRKFIQDDGYKRPELWSKQGRKWLESEKIEHPEYWYDYKWNCGNLPVVGVSWYETDAFCRWLTKTNGDGYTYRLLTEQEWEAAAAGKKGRDYPWGKDFDESKCNTYESEIGKISAVGIFKEGDTLDGLSDLSGNVWEWTRGNWDLKMLQHDFEIPQRIALRGGSWLTDRYVARCVDRLFVLHPNYRGDIVGFRCART